MTEKRCFFSVSMLSLRHLALIVYHCTQSPVYKRFGWARSLTAMCHAVQSEPRCSTRWPVHWQLGATHRDGLRSHVDYLVLCYAGLQGLP